VKRELGNKQSLLNVKNKNVLCVVDGYNNMLSGEKNRALRNLIFREEFHLEVYCNFDN
jgi:hypothetical protein